MLGIIMMHWNSNDIIVLLLFVIILLLIAYVMNLDRQIRIIRKYIAEIRQLNQDLKSDVESGVKASTALSEKSIQLININSKLAALNKQIIDSIVVNSKNTETIDTTENKQDEK